MLGGHGYEVDPGLVGVACFARGGDQGNAIDNLC
jgi:hypothetical protein